jgi:NitT/TauT family transport system substrate-binding protein
MMGWWTRRLAAGVIAVGALFGTGAAHAQDVIRIGLGVDPAFAPIFLAAHERMFRDAGLNVEIQLFTQGGDAMDALVANQVQLGSAAEPTTLIRAARADVRSLGVMTQSGSYIKFVARRGIDDPRQVRRFGIVPGSVSEFATGRLLQRLGIDPASVELVRAGPPEFPALLARGSVDGYFLWEPWAQRGVGEGGRVLLTSGDVGYAFNMWVSGLEPWLAANRARVTTIMQVISRACDIVRADPQRAARATQAMARIPVEQTISLLQEVDCRVRDFTAEDRQVYEDIAQFLVDRRITPQRVDVGRVLSSGVVGR